MKKVFISYTREDAEICYDVKHILEKNYSKNISVFIDTQNIEKGENITEAVRTNILTCDYLILIFTEKCLSSNWVARETTLASSMGKKVLPFNNADKSIHKAFEYINITRTIRDLDSFFNNEFMKTAKLKKTHPDKESTKSSIDKIKEKLESALSDDGLSYLSFRRKNSEIITVERFTKKTLQKTDLNHFIRENISNTKEQVDLYSKFFNTFLSTELTKLDSNFSSLKQGRLIRTIYDVEVGAFYIYEINANNYLVGVTTNQFKVNECDRKMQALKNFIIKTY